MPSGRFCTSCARRASFGFPGEHLQACAEHKLPGMRNLRRLGCQDCLGQAVFGYRGEKPVACRLHRKLGMVDARQALCEDCDRPADRGVPGQPLRACALHGRHGMVVPPVPFQCQSCRSRALFGRPGEQRPVACDLHADPWMVAFAPHPCRDCAREAYFGPPGGRSRPWVCERHRKASHVFIDWAHAPAPLPARALHDWALPWPDAGEEGDSAADPSTPVGTEAAGARGAFPAPAPFPAPSRAADSPDGPGASGEAVQVLPSAPAAELAPSPVAAPAPVRARRGPAAGPRAPGSGRVRPRPTVEQQPPPSPVGGAGLATRA